MPERASRGVLPRVGGLDVRGQALLWAFDVMVRASLSGVWVRGDVPDRAVVWATNHHHWWDAFAAGSILRTTGQRPTVLLATQALRDYAFLEWVDAVPAAEPEQALPALRAGRTLVIMPEGRLVGPGPLGPIRGGAGRIAAAAGVPLVPVALRAVIRGHQHPEVFVDIGAPVRSPELAEAMGLALRRLDDTLATAEPEEPLPGYRLVVPGRRSVNERLSALAGRVAR